MSYIITYDRTAIMDIEHLIKLGQPDKLWEAVAYYQIGLHICFKLEIIDLVKSQMSL